MIVDHLAIWTGPVWLRVTVGRVAMPLFFVLAGYLLTRLSARHLVIASVGLLLPVAVPWIDSPNVLVWYAVGAVVLVITRAPWVVLVVAVAALANGWGLAVGTGYPGAALIGLMAAGVLLRRAHPLEAAAQLRTWRPLEVVGRWPVTVYVGHLLVLEGLRRVGVLG